MIYCPACYANCTSEAILIVHWKCKHSTVTSNIHCKQSTCSRVFSDIYAFKRHLQRVHPMNKIDINNKSNPETTQKISSKDNSPVPALTHILEPIDSANNIPATLQDFTNTTRLDFAESLSQSVAHFVAKLYANPIVPRSLVQEIVTDVQNITNHVQILKPMCIINETSDSTEINHLFEIFQDAFVDHNSEYMSFSYFQNLNTLIMPKKFNIDGDMKSVLKRNIREICYADHNFSYVPLKEVLKLFLELPTVFPSILLYMEKAEKSTEVICCTQADLWITIKQKFSGIVIPLIFYFDDFEINNPLGTHRCVNKIGAVYFSIACIPDEYATLLENTFVAQLHKNKDYDKCDNEQIFWKLIEQIIELETVGVTITVSEQKIQVRFAMLTMAGDNLALHSAFGFYKSFNANFNCIACTADKEARQILVREDASLMRTEKSYANDVNNLEKGIRTECVFNKVPSFHVTRNITFDPDHDILEGTLRYETAKVLNYFINDCESFTLRTLNDKIRFFDYGTKNDINFPPPIKTKWLQNEQIMYTASEMMTFIQYLPLMIGLSVKKKSKHWKLLLLMRKIV